MSFQKALSILAGATIALASSNALAEVGSRDAKVYAEAEVSNKAMPAEPDNSGRNVRDQDDKSLTAMDQSNDPADVEMTQKIRKSITSNDAMSVQAQNVKIITVGGVVTLRGPVKTMDEKTSIESLAKTAGAKSIDNQLEIDRDDTSGEKD